MSNFIIVVMLVALGATFVFLVVEKWGLIDFMQMYARRIFGPFHKLPSCVFCMLFWLCVLIAVPLAIISNIFYLAVPLFSAPLAKAIYENCRATQ